MTKALFIDVEVDAAVADDPGWRPSSPRSARSTSSP